ncbi:NAD(P)/FAD-dependent oxidoreductase [Hoeflea sp. WL0058]|uniref:NAD(P)/FAD-dependent oxidoreductase n=1 Tax=Flavimaribacter sediminis TaxID=2865987 RepID=A0AAE2ZIZ4_9HYPH|nr:NAD(P)/FAD-dependent oxidoreductase [Flavimaribacter sediminis]MBW8635821.1 NAD(P)/FAD-dependent oxidoreductase [Flavimaribacter sediminis]
METTIPSNVLVIGAGLSGLAVAEALSRRNIPVTILEARDRVAEPWRARHPALRLNIHRHFAGLPGLKAPRKDGVFLRRDSLVEYLETYAKRIGAPIRFGAEVLSLDREPVGWSVKTTAGDFGAAHVVFATGRDRLPVIPDWPGRQAFPGEIIHAADLGDVSRFDGKRVLVVGAGNSGADVLNHLARNRPAEICVSVRHGPAVVPARVFGFPLHRLARVFAAMPAWLLDPAFRLTERLFLGDLRRYGVPSHPDGGGTRLIRDGVAFAIDDGFVAALKAGRIRAAPELQRFDGQTARFADGGSFEPDIVIAATGYDTGLQPLLGDLGVLDSQGRPRRPAGEPDSDHPGLRFAGYKAIFTGYFDAARIAADRISQAVVEDLSHRPTQFGPKIHRPVGRAAQPRALHN